VNGNWNVPANWSTTTVPVAGDTVNIIESDNIGRTITYDYPGSITLGPLTIDLTGSTTATTTLSMSANTLSTSVETVGNNGSGIFTQSGGSNSDNAGLVIGNNAGSNGFYTLSGSASLSTTGGSNGEVVGSSGSGTFTQSGGTNSLSGAASLNIGLNSSALGTYTLSGGSLSVSSQSEYIGYGATGNSTQSGGTFNQSGGANSAANIYIAATSNSTGTYNLSNGQASVSGDMVVGGTDSGSGGTGTLSVSGIGVLSVAGTLLAENTPGSSIKLSSGTINAGAINLSGVPALLNWTGGTLNITGAGGLTIGSGGLLGSTFTLGAGRSLGVTHTLTVASGASLNPGGGALTAGSLSNSGNVVFDSNTFTVTGALANQANGYIIIPQNITATVNSASTNAGEIQLGTEAATLTGTGTLANTGLIRGDGVVALPVTNSFGGEIRAENGNRLKFTAASGTNNGLINLQGGTAEFSRALTNGSTGEILGRGTLLTGSTGLINNGSVAFSGGLTDVFGDVNNSATSSTLGITVSGNAGVTFWNDVTNGASALFKVTSGSVATFFGTYGGSGITGGGEVNFEADITPGFSPASVSFGGNVNFDGSTKLVMELGGTTPGAQFDQVHVAGQLMLGGTLDIVLINGFNPTLGSSFDLLDWGSLSGHFSSISLPALSAGLAWNSAQLYTTGVVSVVTAGLLPGDFNGDQHVDAADVLAMEQALSNLQGYRTTKGLSAAQLLTLGDLNGDGKVNNADLQILLSDLQSGHGSIDSVPEPAPAVLCCLALSGLLMLHRRDRIQLS
jgi:hypothetical protein